MRFTEIEQCHSGKLINIFCLKYALSLADSTSDVVLFLFPQFEKVNEIHENITSDNLIDLNYCRLLLGILWMSRLAMSSFSAVRTADYSCCLQIKNDPIVIYFSWLILWKFFLSPLTLMMLKVLRKLKL